MDRPKPELLRKMLRHDPETGKLFWKKRTAEMFKNPDWVSAGTRLETWNAKFTDKEAFISPNGRGYFQGVILGKRYSSHMVVWAMVHGEWPEQEMDHINGIKTDNRLVNLRLVSRSENQQNGPMRKNNTSGVMGVLWVPSRNKWRANIGTKYLGLFTEKSDATIKRKAAEIEHGYHPNHGRAAL